MIRAGLRRLVLALGLIVAVTASCSIVIGAAMGSGVQRSASVGTMLVGSFVTMMGLAVGLRGWQRPLEQDASGSGGERIASSAILIGIGVALLLLGIGIDPRSDIV